MSYISHCKILVINSITINEYTFRFSSSAIFPFLFIPSPKGPALKEKNLLLLEQILSLKSGPHLKSCVLHTSKQEFLLSPFINLMKNIKVNITLFLEKDRERLFEHGRLLVLIQ